MKQILLIIVCLLVHATIAYAQSDITGQVLDAQTKEPLSGVVVQLKKDRNAAHTSSDGSFSLATAAPTDTLLYYLIGYKQKVVAVANHKQLVLLQPASNLLHQVVVSASREAQVRTDAPVAISAISKEVLLDTKPTSLEQVLNKVSGVYMVNLGNEQHTMSIRQPIGYNSLFLYLEDGIPIRTGGNFNHNALIEINMASLKTIEVIRGPASSLYGSEAIGGAINFITQAPSQVLTARLQAEISDRGYRRTDFSISDTKGKLGVYVAGYYAAQRNGIIEHSDFDKLALTLRTDYALSDKSKLVTTASLIDYETEQTGGLDSKRFYEKEYSSLHTFTYRKVKAFRLKSSLEHDWNTANSTRFTLFYRNNSIGQNPFYAIRNIASNPLKARGEINEDTFQSFGLVTQHRKSFSFLNAQLIGGVSADYSPAAYVAEEIAIDRDDAGKYIQFAKTNVLLTNYDVQLLNTAAFAQFELNPVNRLKAMAAIRYDRLDFDFNNHLEPGAFSGAPDERNGFRSLTPKLGMTYDLGRGIGLYGNYSVGFTPPQISELYRGVQVPTLQPARYYNQEAGGWISFAQASGYLDLSVYQLDGQNEIVSVRVDDGSYENQNAGRTRHRGIEYTLRYQPTEAIAFRFSGTNARHTYLEFVERGVDFSGKEMATAPRFISNTELTFKPAFVKGLRMSLEWQHLGKYYLDPANSEHYKGYDLLNARMGYSFSGLEVWVNMLNLTNQLYATTADKYSYGYSYRQGNPRTTHIGVAYNFAAKAN